mgnify:CR=1 FL=1
MLATAKQILASAKQMLASAKQIKDSANQKLAKNKQNLDFYNLKNQLKHQILHEMGPCKS